MKLRLTPRAVADIEAIALYIAAENPRAALAVTESIERRLRQLADYPHSGILREDIGAGVRHLVAGKYLAFYRVTASHVDVLRVIHGKRRQEPSRRAEQDVCTAIRTGWPRSARRMSNVSTRYSVSS